MSFLSLYAQFLFAWFVVLIIPGQDMALILHTTIAEGPKRAMKMVWGICLALLIHLTVASSSLGYLVNRSPLFVHAVRVLGGLYIVYLGASLLLSRKGKPETLGEEKIPTRSSGQLIRTGFLSTLLNPKVTIFFFSLFTGLLPSPITLGPIVLYTAGVLVMTFLFNKILTLLVASQTHLLGARNNQTAVKWVSGLALCMVGTVLIRS